jgi:hypothetical protein
MRAMMNDESRFATPIFGDNAVIGTTLAITGELTKPSCMFAGTAE